MYVYKPDDCKVPVKLWGPNKEFFDGSAIAQIENTASLPFVFKHVSLMPDGHCGYGAPIGGVCATVDVVIPNFVGSDIGCGMGFVETNIPADFIKNIDTPSNGKILKHIIANIKRNIPTGYKHHKTPSDTQLLKYFRPEHAKNPIIQAEAESAKYQMGTLGGGNHFIELQENEDGNLCIMLHSGSRNLGLKIAKYYNDVAKMMNEKYYSSVDPAWQLAFLPINSEAGKEYINAMQFALLFAEENRMTMMEKVKTIVFNDVKKYTDFDSIEIRGEVNIHHNYMAIENHFGKNVCVHRKGAIRMRKGDIGIIPGSMGTASYIVRGKGNLDSFCSASHGAGRIMGRKEFMRQTSKQDAIESMNGIEYTFGKDYSEAPKAYKDIDTVIENEKDLVKVIMRLKPIGVVKG